jgi:hypothetical protein
LKEDRWRFWAIIKTNRNTKNSKNLKMTTTPSATDLQAFWDFMTETSPETIEGWKNRFQCPCCLEECSELGADICQNGHHACCSKCKVSILSSGRTNRYTCPVCRNPDTITPTEDSKYKEKYDNLVVDLRHWTATVQRAMESQQRTIRTLQNTRANSQPSGNPQPVPTHRFVVRDLNGVSTTVRAVSATRHMVTYEGGDMRFTKSINWSPILASRFNPTRTQNGVRTRTQLQIIQVFD